MTIYMRFLTFFLHSFGQVMRSAVRVGVGWLCMMQFYKLLFEISLNWTNLASQNEFVLALFVTEQNGWRVWLWIHSHVQAVLVSLVQLGLPRCPAKVASEQGEFRPSTPTPQSLAPLHASHPVVQIATPCPWNKSSKMTNTPGAQSNTHPDKCVCLCKLRFLNCVSNWTFVLD
jgi:hypothetical protein